MQIKISIINGIWPQRRPVDAHLNIILAACTKIKYTLYLKLPTCCDLATMKYLVFERKLNLQYAKTYVKYSHVLQHMHSACCYKMLQKVHAVFTESKNSHGLLVQHRCVSQFHQKHMCWLKWWYSLLSSFLDTVFLKNMNLRGLRSLEGGLRCLRTFNSHAAYSMCSSLGWTVDKVNCGKG